MFWPFRTTRGSVLIGSAAHGRSQVAVAITPMGKQHCDDNVGEGAQYNILCALNESSPLTMPVLSDRTNIPISALKPELNHMKMLGYVQKVTVSET